MRDILTHLLHSSHDMNPEFLRQLWKELTLHRLIAMPAILFLIFYISFLQGNKGFETVAHTANLLSFMLLIMWGAGLASDAIFEEIQNQSWDSQRMTPLSAWSFTWGKLFGKTIFVWYGFFFCALFFICAKLYFHSATDGLEFLYLMLLGVCAQALALFTALLIQRISAKRSRLQLGLIQVFTILFFGIVYLFSTTYAAPLPGNVREIHWYHFNIAPLHFFIASAIVFSFWLILGIYRLLRVELQIRTAPWIWPLFVLFAIFYYLGFHPDAMNTQGQIPKNLLAFWNWDVAYFMAISLSFLAAFFTPKNFVNYLRWFEDLKNKHYLRSAFLMPPWILSMFIGLCLLIILSFLVQRLTVSEHKIALIQMGWSISLFGFLLRDIGILYFLNWKKDATRGHLACILYLIVLYVFLPLFLSLLGLPHSLLPSLEPFAWLTQESTVTASQVVLINFLVYAQVCLVAYGVYYRWQALMSDTKS